MNWYWTIRGGDGGMNGLEFCRALTAGELRHVLVHAAPGQAGRGADGDLVASGGSPAPEPSRAGARNVTVRR